MRSTKADSFATDDVLLYGIIATEPRAHDMKVVGEYLSYDPYGLVYRRDDPGFAAVVNNAFARMAADRRLTELYNKWFSRRLPKQLHPVDTTGTLMRDNTRPNGSANELHPYTEGFTSLAAKFLAVLQAHYPW
jgi:hypothetical protein